MRIAIAIPVYKPHLLSDEVKSLQQCLAILHQYDVFLVCPENLDTTAYQQIALGKLKIEHFPPKFFKGIEGYNNLMMSRSFYKRFVVYDYLLIYQLDAWVFSNQLKEWCAKGYDYIGAPWFELHKTHEEGYNLWCAGNGGLSLRRIEKFIQVTNPYALVKLPRQIFQEDYHSLKDLVPCLLRSVGLKGNNLRHFRRKVKKDLWEDTFFSYGLTETRFKLNIPPAQEAALFSFECSPGYLYEHITKGVLPFGCHAWRKYQYDDFWKQFIPYP